MFFKRNIMKLKSKYNNKIFSIVGAVENECYDDQDDLIKTALASSECAATILGKLIERLYDNNILSKEDILHIVNYSYESE